MGTKPRKSTVSDPLEPVSLRCCITGLQRFPDSANQYTAATQKPSVGPGNPVQHRRMRIKASVTETGYINGATDGKWFS